MSPSAPVWITDLLYGTEEQDILYQDVSDYRIPEFTFCKYYADTRDKSVRVGSVASIKSVCTTYIL